VYGERQNPDGAYASVVPRFMRALRTGEPIIFFGDGYQTRDFVSVHDVVEANLIAAVLAEKDFFVCNVATGTSINLHDLVKMLECKTDTKVTKILHMPAQGGEVRHSQASIDRLSHLKKEFYARSKTAIVTTPFVQSTL
jgi:nucleoside-diphosphate-sugar epimerase